MDADENVDASQISAQLCRAGADADFDDFHATRINPLLALRDRLRPADPPETVPAFRFGVKDLDHGVVRLADATYGLNQLREIFRAFGDRGLISPCAAKAAAGDVSIPSRRLTTAIG